VRKGRETTTVASAEERDRRIRRPGDLAEFFASSPLREVELNLDRLQDGPREVQLWLPAR
jgi:hypothetical protein